MLARAPKLLPNILASGGSIGWSMLLQLASVPVLTAAWGPEKYGVWLMLCTVPIYLSLSDLGFPTAATSDMAISTARGDHAAAIRTYHAMWLLILVASAIAILVGSIVLLPAALGADWHIPHPATIFVLVLYTIGGFASVTFLCAYRATGNFAIGTALHDVMLFIEGALVLIVASLGASFFVCASVMFMVRCINAAAMSIGLRKLTPWLVPGIGQAHAADIRRLLPLALSAAAMPTAIAASLQGLVVVAGLVVSPVAAATFAAVRTGSRIALQLAGIINRATIPEFAASYARADATATRYLLRLNAAAVLFVLAPAAGGFAFYGSHLVALWSHNHIIAEPAFVALMSGAALLHGIWFYASNLLSAINKHFAFGAALLPICLTGVLLAIPAGTAFGLLGIASTLLVTELLLVGVCAFFTLRTISRERADAQGAIEVHPG